LKIGDKLSKVDESMTIQMYDNGFVFELSGRDSSDDWANVKIVCNSMEEVTSLMKEAITLPRS
jgi:hypothetical protein